jgi:hypothetical protein
VPRAIDYKVLKALNIPGRPFILPLSFPSPSPFSLFFFPSSEGAEGASAVFFLSSFFYFFSVSGHVGVVRVYPFDMVLSLAPAGGQAVSQLYMLLELSAELSNLLGGRASGRPYSPLNETSKQKEDKKKLKQEKQKKRQRVSFSSLSTQPFALVIDLVSAER